MTRREAAYSVLFVLGLAGATTPTAATAEAGRLLWTRELGTVATDYARGVAIDADGNILVAGRTDGTLAAPRGGASDAFVAKLDHDGKLLWTRQLGGVGYDWAAGVAVGRNGAVVIAGRTDGALGGVNNGSCDGFVASFLPDGRQSWIQQVGGAGDDWLTGIATDAAGNVYVAGGVPGPLTGRIFTPGTPAVPPAAECASDVLPGKAGWPDSYNAFLAKYSASGVLQWTRRLGTSLGEGANAVTVDAGGDVIITGSTFGSLGAPVQPVYNDIFFAKYAPDGRLQWVRQYGAVGSDGAWAITTDRDRNIVVAGDAFAAFAGPWQSAFSDQAWVAKFPPDGSWGWIRQIATTSYDAARGVTTDAAGTIYVVGRTDGSLVGESNGSSDAFIAAYWPKGTLRWIRQLGWARADWARGVAVAPSQDSVVIVGASSFRAANEGLSNDVLIAKFATR